MSDLSIFQKASEEIDQSAVQRSLEQARRSRDQWKREYEAQARQIEKMEAKLDLLTSIDGLTAKPPSWLVPAIKKGKKQGIANTVSSDQHFGEVIKPEEVGGVNAYNSRIAEMRFRRHMEKFIVVARDHLAGYTYDGAHIWWNGDCFSGSIHPELTETNDFVPYAAFDRFLDPVVAGLTMVADHFGKLHISARRGNHTRTKPKTPYKGRVKDSLDWLFMRMVAREFKGNKKVTFDIPESDDGLVITQYDTRYLATHGDQFRGGSGISGILTPLSLGNYRKTRRNMSIGQEYDVMILGHFHQYMTIPGVIVNGSLKGLDEFAYGNNFSYEEPQQAMWITTPEHGPAFHIALKPMDRESEGW